MLAAIVRGARPIAPSQDDTLEVGDELLLVTGDEADEGALGRLLAGEPEAEPTAPDAPVEAPEAGEGVL